MLEWRPWVFAGKKAIIWDLDNTLYRITPEFGDILDSGSEELLPVQQTYVLPAKTMAVLMGK